MNREEFWKLIDDTHSFDDPSKQAFAIIDELSQQTTQEIMDFDRHMDSLLSASYSWKLWGAAYLINGGCSDDGFDYFRGWLISQGQAVFDKALENPDSLAEIKNLEGDVEGEDLLYAAMHAYETVTGREIPSEPSVFPGLGAGWDFDDDDEMKKRYPKLHAKFC